jgi:integrase
VMAKPKLRLVAPPTVNRTVAPRRPRNADLRTREHLTDGEVEKMIEAVGDNRHGHRDALMVLLAYRHGLRAAEVVDLRGADRLQNRVLACPPGQERYAKHPPIDRPGVARAAPPPEGKH